MSTSLRLPTARWVDQVFDELFAPFAGPTVAQAVEPRTNVHETETGLRVETELPGVDREDIDVSFEDATLTIRGERSTSLPESARVRRARWAGKFARTLRFRKPIDVSGITAELKNGVLVLELPFSADARPQRIEIR